jgi:hypothetical protein
LDGATRKTRGITSDPWRVGLKTVPQGRTGFKLMPDNVECGGMRGFLIFESYHFDNGGHSHNNNSDFVPKFTKTRLAGRFMT